VNSGRLCFSLSLLYSFSKSNSGLSI
jgi:hypothetical protein